MGSFIWTPKRYSHHIKNQQYSFFKMKSLIILGLFFGLALSLPVPQSPFFSVKITQGHLGGSQTGYGATISKQKVNVIKSTADGEIVEEEPFIDHQPPFLALPPVKPYEPLPLPSAPRRVKKTN